MYYWKDKDKRAKQAAQHTEEMEQKFHDEIDAAVRNTAEYRRGQVLYPPVSGALYPDVEIVPVQMDSVSAIEAYSKGKTSVLNFASYTHPGGKFLEGSCAQEESLCHSSFLYNVLRCFDGSRMNSRSAYYETNRKSMDGVMYTDAALYIPDVEFQMPKSGRYQKCDVITCAAPNLTAGRKYAGTTSERNRLALNSRINMVVEIAAREKVDALILGAFGCGVFGQNPAEVSECFSDAILRNQNAPKGKTIVFAIPDERNFVPFSEALAKVIRP
jgi:uncharacterized protein (TIGR02452 family)